MMKYLLTACLAFFVAGTLVAKDKPNVLMICIDDLNDWIGCLGGHPQAKTPHMDKLAASGRNFTNAHCVVPVCSPSRVCVMSGLHATTHGSYDLGPSYQSIERLNEQPTIQGYFKANGYKTFAGGKVLHHGFGGRLAADVDEVLPGKKGGPRPKKMMNWPGGAWDWGPYPEKDEELGDYQVAKSAAAALGKKHDKPFFMSVGIYRPHVPMFVPQKWFDMYPKDKIVMPKAPLSDLDDLPPNFKGKLNVEPVHAELLEKGDWRGMVQAYLACVSFADHCVGMVMEGLNNGPNKDNTIVVLWSDHGFHLGEKQKWAKRTLWEESTRTPFMISGPEIEPGDCAEAVSLLDIYPTLVERCDLSKNIQLDGISLEPQLRSPKTAREEPVLTSSYYENHAIRTKHWRYIRYKDGAEELYDHRKDSDEFTNLANHPEHAEIKRSLAKWLPKNAAAEVKKGGKKPKRKR
jgi:arylsulfatase A-like enzyme